MITWNGQSDLTFQIYQTKQKNMNYKSDQIRSGIPITYLEPAAHKQRKFSLQFQNSLVLWIQGSWVLNYKQPKKPQNVMQLAILLSQRFEIIVQSWYLGNFRIIGSYLPEVETLGISWFSLDVDCTVA